MTRGVFLLIVAGMTAGLARGASSEPSLAWGKWEDSRSLYDAGRLDEALSALLSNPTPDAHYFYNLGNVYYRLGQPGVAVAYFEKANRLKAHDSDILHNLAVARSTLQQQIGIQRLDAASTWIESLVDRVPLDEIRSTIGLLAFIVSLVWIRGYRKHRNLGKTLLRPAGLLGLLGLAITVSLYLAQRLAASSPPAVCTQAHSIRSGPGDQYLDLGKLEAGMKIRLLNQSATSEGAGASELWQQIRFTHSEIGWIRASSLLLL